MIDMGQPQGGGPEAGAPAEDQGFTICMHVGPDGITVYQEGSEAEGPGMDAGTSEPAQSIGDALKKVLMLYQQLSQGGDAQSQFEAGYGGQGEKRQMPQPQGTGGM